MTDATHSGTASGVLPDGTAIDRADIATNPPQRALHLHRELDRVWADLPGWRGFFTSVNHGTIGLRFMATSFVFFAIGGVLAMLIRAQLATREGAFLDTDLYNQIFTMHGTIMMFLFAIPMLEGLGLWLLPKILGARDMAFPRLSALGYFCYLFGGSVIVLSLLFGVAPDDGWFMYTPLSDRTHSPGVNADVWLLGVTFVEISAMAAAVEITVTILRCRAAHMPLTRMPLMGWYLLGTSVMMLVGFPPLILGSILLEVQRAFDWPFFDVARGGDPLLWQHLFWLFGHPEVYIIFLPAAGALSTIIPVLSRTTILGYGAIVAAIIGLVFLSFGLWVHHMFTVGIPHMALAFFSAASALVAVPTAVQIFAWIGTMWDGKVQMRLPMLYVMGFFATFVMGGLTGVMLAMVPFNWQAHDTAFVTAHLHYVLIGGFVFPMLAAVTYWMPLICGRWRIRGLGEAAFWLILIGFHGTFFLMHLTGLLGMPRRIDVYPGNPEWEWLNLTSSVFGMIQSAGFALFAFDIIMQWLFGRRSWRNPWKAPTLDWAMPVPSPSYNFASLPGPRQPDADAILPLARGEGLLPGAPRGLRETLVVEPASGRPQHVAVLATNTALPVLTSAAIGSFFGAMLLGFYWLAPLGILATIIVAWRWGAIMGSTEDRAPAQVAPDLHLPLHFQVRNTLALTGAVALLVGDATLYASLLFGVGFLTVVAPGWPAPPSGLEMPVLVAGLAAVAAMAVGSVAARLAEANRARPSGHLWTLVGTGMAVLALVMLGVVAMGLDDPTRHARDALRGVVVGFAVAHGVIAGLLALRSHLDHRQGRVGANRYGAIPGWRLFQDFWLATSAISLAVVLAQEVL
ncbi:cytochrome c oxidase subunit I [Paracoccus aestuarii]|uniref:Cytochrome c oxidase subunit I n=1 Tax=Paracoccus aestuarii TaxID=453842 RepID=A0A418ZWK4_9RHOB|nr:cytochrome c oxidase subunit I [Paracoccus aestuarii]RJL04873.1 cytochrome c oxidase subunit I [Paracoccus aestuarii]WCQ98106.1 cytochrome c oxidase subunit I [Paracoccus aestuarii]